MELQLITPIKWPKIHGFQRGYFHPYKSGFFTLLIIGFFKGPILSGMVFGSNNPTYNPYKWSYNPTYNCHFKALILSGMVFGTIIFTQHLTEVSQIKITSEIARRKKSIGDSSFEQ